MAILKLENAGDTMTARIKHAETTAGKFGPQVKFEMENGDVLYISEPTAMRQLARIPLEVGECAGEMLVFSRDPNPSGKPYWGIKLASAAEKAPPSKRLSYTEAAKPSGPSKGSIPEMDDFPSEEYGASIHAPDSPYDNPGPIPPFHKPTQAASVAPVASDKMAVARAYLDLLAWVQNETKLPPDVVQSASATIWIEWNKRGLVK